MPSTIKSLALLLLCVAVTQASVTVTRTSDDGPQPSTMEIEVHLPHLNMKVRIPLVKSDAFENVPMTVLENGVSRTFSAHQVHHENHSHYRDIDSKSVISVRCVDGKRQISGHVMHDGTSYFVEPVGDSEHKVTRNVLKPDLIAKQMDKKKLMEFQSRRKRQARGFAKTENVVEILLLIDHTVYAVFKTMFVTDDRALLELHYYYTHILTGLDTAYRNIQSISISVSCIGLVIAKTPADSTWMPPAGAADATEGGTILGTIRTYSVGKTADHVMAFTRLDVKAGTNRGVNGMAYVSGTCTGNRQSINEDQGLHSWDTAAHELAHNLGADHDPADGSSCDQSNKYIMASGSYSLADVAKSYRFSDCTVASIGRYIKGLGANNCLKTAEGTQVPDLAKTTPEGTRLTLNQVCLFSYAGSASKLYFNEGILKNPASICAQIYCSQGGSTGHTISGLRAPAGTPCGNKKSCKWDGSCTADAAAPAADESCFWGDTWPAESCVGWTDFMNYQREINDINGLKINCNGKLKFCCKSMKATCTF